MQLMMYLGNDLIDSMLLNSTRLSEPGYLGGFKRILKQRHYEIIQEAGIEPEYLVVNLASTNYSNTSTATEMKSMQPNYNSAA